ncbi:MAG: alpha/beta fold hydrolase [Pseudomonadota bacterium]
MNGNTTKTEFTNAAGETLAAAFETPAGPVRAVALFAHCFSCSKDIKAARTFSRALRDAGFAVLRFDFTGLGASEGDFANTNFSSNVDDLVAAADFLRREHQAPSLLIGHSLGGAAAIVAAARMPELKGVAVIGAPADAAHVTAQLGDARKEIEERGVAEVLLAGRPFTIKKQFLEDLESQSVLTAASSMKRPLLVMHAPQDATVGIENASEIFRAAKHPKSFVSLDTADHLLSRTEDAAYAAAVLAAWAGRFLDGAGDDAPAAPPPHVAGGAGARAVPGEALAVALSLDGHPMTIDAGAAEGGSDLGPNPTRTVEGALAACAVMTMKMYARRKKWPLDDVEVRVTRAAGEDAHVSRILEKSIKIHGDLSDEQRARLQEIADKCPVHRMLSEGVEIRSALT